MNISNRQLEIIKSAGEIMTERGITGLTTKKIAEKVGFSEAAIYRHFKGKEAIILALLSYLADNMDERFAKIDPFLAPEDHFKAIFYSQTAFFSANPYYAVAVFSEGLMADNEALNKKIAQIMAVKQSALLPILEAGQREGVFTKAITAEAMAHVVMGTFRLQMFKWRANQFQFDIEQANEKVMNDVLKLIKTK